MRSMSGSSDHAAVDVFARCFLRRAVVSSMTGPSGRFRASGGASRGRQVQAKRTPHSFGAFHRDGAAHQIDVTLHNRQAESGVKSIRGPRRIGAVEAFENMIARLGTDPDARITHF